MVVVRLVSVNAIVVDKNCIQAGMVQQPADVAKCCFGSYGISDGLGDSATRGSIYDLRVSFEHRTLLPGMRFEMAALSRTQMGCIKIGIPAYSMYLCTRPLLVPLPNHYSLCARLDSDIK